MMEFEIYHDFTHCRSHYILSNKINPKNHKQYIFKILSKKWPKFGQKGPFSNFPKKYENIIFSTPKTMLSTKKLANSN